MSEMDRLRQFKLPTQADESKMNAEQLKKVGNALFSGRKYHEAISYYNKAIIKNPTVPYFFTNRALCRMKLQQWDQACSDCHRAIDMDPAIVKAHFYMGQSLLEMNLVDEAVKYLQRAYDLSKQQVRYYGDEITTMLRLARKRRWSLLEEKRISQEIELQTYLTDLMLRDKDDQISRLLAEEYNSEQQQQRRQSIDCQSVLSHSSQPAADDVTRQRTPATDDVTSERTAADDDGVTSERTTPRAQPTPTASVSAPMSEQLESRILAVESSCDQHIKLLSQLFERVDERRRKRDVPDYLCGRISFMILRDPVITPSGITYDRKDLVEHLQRVGHFDPVTRASLTVDKLIPNLAMKEVVDAFLLENEWAHEY